MASVICSHQAGASVGQPAGEHVAGAALDDVEEPVAVQVDDLGREHGAMLGGGVQEPLLVDTDPTHALEAIRVVDDRVGVVGDRRVRGVPADAELDRCRSDREPVDVHHVGQPGPGPFGQRRPRRDRVDVLGPRTHLTQRLPAPPAAAGEHQHRRHPSDRQIADRGSAAAMANRRTPHPGHHLGPGRVSTASHHSPSRNTWARTTSSGMPTSAVASSIP